MRPALKKRVGQHRRYIEISTCSSIDTPIYRYFTFSWPSLQSSRARCTATSRLDSPILIAACSGCVTFQLRLKNIFHCFILPMFPKQLPKADSNADENGDKTTSPHLHRATYPEETGKKRAAMRNSAFAKKSFAICEEFQGIALQSTASQILIHFVRITKTKSFASYKILRKLRTNLAKDLVWEKFVCNTNKMICNCEKKRVCITMPSNSSYYNTVVRTNFSVRHR